MTSSSSSKKLVSKRSPAAAALPSPVAFASTSPTSISASQLHLGIANAFPVPNANLRNPNSASICVSESPPLLGVSSSLPLSHDPTSSSSSSLSSFLSWNCHSLNNDHLSELSIVAHTHRPAVIALCETRRTPSSAPPRLLDYRWYGADFATNSGGVGLFVADSLASSACPNLCSSTAQAIFVRVHIPSLGQEVLIGSLYCPPKETKQWDAMQTTIHAARAAARSSHSPLLLLGDLNARHSVTGDRIPPLSSLMETSSSSSSSGSSSSSSVHNATAFDSHRGKSLVSLLNELDLFLLNVTLCYGQPTFPASGSVLDLAISSDPSLVTTFRPESGLLLHSDHHAMFGRFASLHSSHSAPPLLPSNVRQGVSLSSSSPKLAFDKMDVPTFQSLLEPLCTSWLASSATQQLLSSSPATASLQAVRTAIESLTLSLSTCFFDAAAACAPKLPPERRVINHWWSSIPGVHAALRRYHYCYRRYRKGKSDATRYDEYLESRRAWRAIRTQAKQQAWADLCSKIAEPQHRKLAWSAWHRTLPSAFAPLNSIRLSPEQSLPSSHRESLNRLSQHFANTCLSPLDHSPHERMVLDAVENMSNESFKQRDRAASSAAASNTARSQVNTLFTVDQVAATARNQRLRTALGPDGFSPYFIRHATPAALTALTALLNFSWRFGVMPASWRNANVMPLLKDPASDRSSPTNFRPISLTSVLIRFFERCVLYRLRPLITAQLAKQQAGFRAQHSTYTHLHRLQHVITSAFEKHRYQSVIFLDIAKAFDSTWHAGILYKLARTPFNITGRAWHWVEALLSDRSIRVVDQGLQADWHPITAGVPQGSVLAPLLFVLFINDIVFERVQCEIALYADDIALWGADSSEQGDEQLRRCLPHLLRWSRKWKLHFNIKKSASVCFRRLRKKTEAQTRDDSLAFSSSDFAVPPPFSFEPSLTLPQCDSYKYLGLIFDYRLRWEQQTSAVRAKLQQSVNMITRIIPAAPSSGAATLSSFSPSSSLSSAGTSTTAAAAAVNAGPSLLVIRQLTHSIVRSQLCYGLPIWSPPTKVMAQQLQSLLVRPLLRSLALPPSTHQLSLLVECASTSFSALYQASLINFYERLMCTPARHPSNQLFREQRDRFNRPTAVRGSFLHSLRQLPLARQQLVAGFESSWLPSSIAHYAREITFKEWNDATTPLPSTSSSSRPSTHDPSSQQSPSSSRRSSRSNTVRHLPSTAHPSSSSSSSSASATASAHRPAETLAGTSLRAVRFADQVPPSFYLSFDPPRVARLRARLRLGRARLAASCFVRGLHNPPSSSALASPLCPHPPCRAAKLDETREHALLDCPLYDSARGFINAMMRQNPSLNRTMTLQDALGAVESIRSRADRRLVLRLTSKLLIAIDDQRHL